MTYMLLMLLVKTCLSKWFSPPQSNPEVLSFRFSLVKDFAMPKVAPLGQLGILPDKLVKGRRGKHVLPCTFSDSLLGSMWIIAAWVHFSQVRIRKITKLLCVIKLLDG